MENLRSAGWLYMCDDGYGPWYTAQYDNARRYLNHWEIFERVPSDGHVCERTQAYGECIHCLRLKLPSPPTKD